MATRASRAEPRPLRAGAVRELVDILELQRPIAVGIALAVAVVGFTIAVIAPGVLPPHPIVGASVGIAAVAIGVVAAVAADAGDRTVRGVRHVRPTGAAVAAAGDEPLPQLTDWVAEQLEDSDHVRIAIVAAGTDTRSAGPLAEALGRALAYRGNRVLVADLTVEDTDRPGVAEVGRGELRLSQAVEFAPGVDLARVRSGASRVDALAALPRVTETIAGQVDVLLAALPGLRHPGALLGSTAAARSLLLAIEGVSSRVEVLAGIEALETARAPADLVILPPDMRLPAFDDAPSPAASEGSGVPVGGVAPSDEPDADTPPMAEDPAAGAEPDAGDPEGADGADEPESPVDVADVADESGDEPGPGTGDGRLLEAEDERFAVPDAHDLAFLDGEERHPATDRAVDEQLDLLDDGVAEPAAPPEPVDPGSADDGSAEGTDNGTIARGGPADLGDTAELDPVGAGSEPPADPPPPVPPVVRATDEPATDEPAAGAFEELQRIAAVVALERDVTTDQEQGQDRDDDLPGGVA